MPGWFPCCCTTPGSSVPPGSSVLPPFGSSQLLLPGCEPCIGGLISRFYMIEIEGVEVGQKPECADACDSLNGAYVCEIISTSAEGCFGALVLPGVCTDTHGSACYRQMLLSFGLPTPSLGVPVRVTLGPRSDDTGAGECSSVTTIVWQGYVSNAGQKAACLTLDRAELAYHSRTGSLKYCEGENSTAYITAI